jgi:hypothetical protein
VPPSNLTAVIKGALKNLSVLAGALGSLLPGLTYFLHAAPPLFALSALLSGGLALAIFVRVFVTGPDRVAAAKKGFHYVLVAVFMGTAYGMLLPLLTVTPPTHSTFARERFQIGFRTFDFSLTPEARNKKQQFDLKTPEDLMLAFGGYEPGATTLIWRPWTIQTAGLILIVIFLTTFLLWAYGLALLAWGLTTGRTAPVRNS